MMKRVMRVLRRSAKRESSTYLVSAVGAAVLLLTIVSRQVVPVLFAQLQVWRGYYTVLIDRNAEAAGVVGGGESGGSVSGIISRATTPVALSRIDRVEWVSLVEASERLVPLDPRLDPYIESAGGYFRARTRQVVYVPSDVSPWWTWVRMRGEPERFGTSISLPAFHPLLVVLRCLCILGVIGLFARDRSRRDAVLLGSIPLCLHAAQAGSAGLISAAALAVAWGRLMPVIDSWVRSMWASGDAGGGSGLSKGRLTAGVVAALGALLGLALHPRPLLGLLSLGVALVGLGGVVVLVAGLRMRRGMALEHRLFVPVRLSRSGWRDGAGDVRSIVILLAAVVVGSLLNSGLERILRSELPAPVVRRGAESYDPETLEAMFGEVDAGGLPTLADFAAHVAYQEWLHTGRPYEFPAAGTKVELSTFREVDGVVLRERVELGAFDADWFDSFFAKASVGGPPALLIEAAGPVRAKRGGAGGSPSSVAHGVAPVVVYVILLLPVISGGRLSALFSRGRSLQGSMLRRAQSTP